MAIYQGTYYRMYVTLVDSTGAAIGDITAWTFKAEFRVAVGDAEPLITLTSLAGDFVITDGPNSRLEMRISPANSALLSLGAVIFDVERTDSTPGPIWLFGGRAKVKQPVTR